MLTKITFSVLLMLGSLATVAQQPENTAIVVVDAQRGALIRWLLPKGPFPRNGFQVERTVAGGAAQIVGRVAPLANDAKLAPERATLAKKYVDLAVRPISTDPKAKSDYAEVRLTVELMTLQDPLLARYLALSIEDPKAPIGSVATYTIRTLGENGLPAAVHATSPLMKLDPMPPPQPPPDLHGLAMRKGVALFWSAPSKQQRNPASAVTYEVRRRDGTLITPEPVLRITARGPSGEEAPGVIDPTPPVETTSSYTITALDIFARRGPESAPVQVFFPDFTALDPPLQINATTSEGKALLSWDAPANKYRKGWKIVRAFQPAALGDPLTPQPVTAPKFIDTTGRVGSTYYYRITAVNVRDEEGAPMVSQAVLVRSGKAPASPANLTAELKTGKIILRWDAAPENVAAFQVERSMDGKQWNLLTRTGSTEPRFSDVYPRDVTGTVQYRVVSWSFDDTASLPSAPITVALPDTQPPLTPNINSIDGSDGKVLIAFTPAGGAKDASQFYVLRSLSYRDSGAVVNPDPLPAAARSFTDPSVEAGTTYFYRLVAVDDAGNRSTPSDPPATVRVSPPALPPPPVAKAHFEAQPFPRVVFDFAASPSPSIRYALERRDAAGRWILIQGPFPQETATAMDTMPPKGGKATYRLVTVASNGVPGPKSAEIEVPIPK